MSELNLCAIFLNTNHVIIKKDADVNNLHLFYRLNSNEFHIVDELPFLGYVSLTLLHAIIS